MLVEKKDTDFYLGMLPDEVMFSILREYGFDDSWITLPFLNINNKALAINRRSETSRKAVLLYKGELYILKEIPWYCSNREFVNFETEIQNFLMENNVPIPQLLRNYDGKFFTTLMYDSENKYFFIQKYIEGKSWDGSDGQVESSAETLAKFHLTLAQAPTEIFDKYNPPKASVFELANRMIDVAKQVTGEKTELDSKIKNIIFEYCSDSKERLAQLHKSAISKGYNQIKIPVHGDYNPFNLIFDISSHKVKGIIDFDNALIDNPAHDIAEALLDFCFFTYKEHITRFSCLPKTFNTERAKLFLKKYHEQYDRLLETVSPYLGEVATAITIELISLAIARDDYSYSELYQINKIIDIPRKNIEQILNF